MTAGHLEEAYFNPLAGQVCSARARGATAIDARAFGLCSFESLRVCVPRRGEHPQRNIAGTEPPKHRTISHRSSKETVHAQSDRPHTRRGSHVVRRKHGAARAGRQPRQTQAEGLSQPADRVHRGVPGRWRTRHHGATARQVRREGERRQDHREQPHRWRRHGGALVSGHAGETRRLHARCARQPGVGRCDAAFAGQVVAHRSRADRLREQRPDAVGDGNRRSAQGHGAQADHPGGQGQARNDPGRHRPGQHVGLLPRSGGIGHRCQVPARAVSEWWCGDLGACRGQRRRRAGVFRRVAAVYR